MTKAVKSKVDIFSLFYKNESVKFSVSMGKILL